MKPDSKRSSCGGRPYVSTQIMPPRSLRSRARSSTGIGEACARPREALNAANSRPHRARTPSERELETEKVWPEAPVALVLSEN